MIDLGANPHIKDLEGNTDFDLFGLSYLKNIQSVKSVFFPIKKFPTGNLGDSWCYTTGVYDGKFGRVVGTGGEGVVIQGEWNGKPAAYKFVQMKGLAYSTNYDVSFNDMSERLTEMTEMMETPGDTILTFEAHFR